MYVGNADAVAPVARLAAAAQEFVHPGDRLLRGACAVVAHLKNNIVRIFKRAHPDAAALLLALLQRMDDRVFHQRLQDQLGRIIIEQLAGHLRGEINPFIARALDVGIQHHMAHLLRNADRLAPLADADAEERRQLLGDADGFLSLVRLDQPDDRGERIIEEVRVNLEFERADFGFFLLTLLFIIFGNERVQPVDDTVVPVGKDGDFVSAGNRFRAGRVVRLDAADKPVKRLRERARHKRAEQDARRQADEHHIEHRFENLPRAGGDDAVRNLFDEIQPALRVGAISVCVVSRAQIAALLRKRAGRQPNGGDIAAKRIPVRSGNDLSRAVDDIERARFRPEIAAVQVIKKRFLHIDDQHGRGPVLQIEHNALIRQHGFAADARGRAPMIEQAELRKAGQLLLRGERAHAAVRHVLHHRARPVERDELHRRVLLTVEQPAQLLARLVFNDAAAARQLGCIRFEVGPHVFIERGQKRAAVLLADFIDRPVFHQLQPAQALLHASFQHRV